MQKICILTELSPAQRKPHGLNSIFRLTHVLCQEWSCRYFLRHETKNWSHFTLSCCYIAGIPTTLFLIWGKPSCFLYETVSCLLWILEKKDVMGVIRKLYYVCWKYCKYKEWVSFFGFMVNDSECGTIERAYRWIFKKYTAISMIAIYQTESKHIKKLCKYIKWISPFVYCWFIMSMGLCKHFVHNALTRVMQSVFTDPLSL